MNKLCSTIHKFVITKTTTLLKQMITDFEALIWRAQNSVKKFQIQYRRPHIDKTKFRIQTSSQLVKVKYSIFIHNIKNSVKLSTFFPLVTSTPLNEQLAGTHCIYFTLLPTRMLHYLNPLNMLTSKWVFKESIRSLVVERLVVNSVILFVLRFTLSAVVQNLTKPLNFQILHLS